MTVLACLGCWGLNLSVSLFLSELHVQFGWTSLHIAAREGHAEVIKLLIEHNANIDEDESVSVIKSTVFVKICRYASSLTAEIRYNLINILSCLKSLLKNII